MDRTALFAIASQFFELLGYPDHWLIDVAGLALERGERAFAVECLRRFEEERAFYGTEAAVLGSLWRALELDVPAPAEAEEEIGDLVEGDD